MKEPSTLSRWVTAPFTWASKAANATVNATAAVFNNGPVLTATFVATQITTAAADFCFSIPNADRPYWLNCVDSGLLANLTRALEANASAVAVPLFQCYETAYYNAASYGSTVFDFDVCDLYWDGTLSPLVNNILSTEIPPGIWSGLDTAAAVGIGIVGVLTLAAVGGVTFCLIRDKCCRKDLSIVGEASRLVRSQDQEEAFPRTAYEV